jgi:hypothetical protein
LPSNPPGAKPQHAEQDAKGDQVVDASPPERDAKGFQHAECQAANDRSRQAAKSAQRGGGERKQPGRRARRGRDIAVVHTHQHSRQTTQSGGEHERDVLDPANRNAHLERGVGVLGGRADRAAIAGELQERAEHDDRADADAEHDHIQRAEAESGHREVPRGQDLWELAGVGSEHHL